MHHNDFHGILLSFPTIIDIHTAIYYVSRTKCDMVFNTYTIFKSRNNKVVNNTIYMILDNINMFKMVFIIIK